MRGRIRPAVTMVVSILLLFVIYGLWGDVRECECASQLEVSDNVNTQILASSCNDQVLFDLNDVGIPLKATRTENYDWCGDAPYFTTYDASTHYIYQRTMHGRVVTAAIAKDYALDAVGREEISEFIFDTWGIYWNEFGGFPYDSYTVAIGNDVRGCSAFGRGLDIDVTRKTWIAHDIFHAWSGNAYRQVDNISWYWEGMTTYYGDIRQGEIPYYHMLINFYNIYRDYVAAEQDMAIGNSSMDDADYNHHFVSAKGALIAFLLDRKLSETGNHIGEVNRIMYQRYGIDYPYPFTNDDILSVLKEVSGQDFTEFFEKYVFGRDPLPQPDSPVWICHSKRPDAGRFTITGSVIHQGAPVCAMVLANGQYMFTSDADGNFSLDVPLDENGQITVFAFCSGLAPFQETIYPSGGQNLQIELVEADEGKGMDVAYTLQSINPDRVRVTGTVTYDGSPVCAMVLANGQYMFTSEEDSNFSLDVPLDDRGRVTLFSFCSGLPPHESFKPQITPGMLTFHKADENMISSLMNK